MESIKRFLTLTLILTAAMLSSVISPLAKEADINPVSNDIEISNTQSDIISITGLTKKATVLSGSTDLPQSYNSREYTTAIKDQYSTNCCWAYSAVSALELIMNKNGDYTQAYSPLHMAYIQSADENNEGCVIRKYWLRTGGRPEFSLGYLTSGIGTRESYLENLDVMNISNMSIENEKNYKATAKQFDENSTPLISLDRYIYVDTNDRDNVKKAIYDYGFVGTSFSVIKDSFDDALLNYCHNTADTNNGHAILIVGWDDHYSKDNFKYPPDTDGAWLCQNSWGEEAGDDGFFYISYEDKTLFAENFGNTWTADSYHRISRFEKTYSEADCIALQNWSPSDTSESITYLNKYDFGEEELLKSVEFDTSSQGAAYTVFYIPSDSSDEPDADSDQWITLSSGSVDYCGNIIADIDDFEIPSGTGFIAVTLTKENGSPNKMGIIHSTDSYFKVPNLENKASYVLFTNSGFRNVANSHSIVFPIKARTVKNYLCGDAYRDKMISITDATVIQRYLASYINKNFCPECADANNDLDITIEDVTVLQLFLTHRDDVPYINKIVE